MTSVIPSPPKPDELAKEKPTQVNEGKARVTEVRNSIKILMIKPVNYSANDIVNIYFEWLIIIKL